MRIVSFNKIYAMKKLIVFVTCQRTGSSVSAEIFYRHGMSLGPFSFFMASPEKPLGLCEAMPIFKINHAIHRIRYGFDEDAVPYDRAGLLMKDRDAHPFDIDRLPSWIIQQGIETIRTVVDSAPISGFKHPASVLFWPFWRHVFSEIPGLEVFPVFLLRSPSGIAASYARRAKRPEFQNAMFDLIEVYLARMLEIYETWVGPRRIVRFSDEYYREDLRNAVELLDLPWNPEIFDQYYQASATVAVDEPVDHPVQDVYARWQEICSRRSIGGAI